MAKEEIYTIPVIDAFNEVCECPLCHLYRTLNQDSLDFILSPAYMESDVRLLTNEKGFCQSHYKQLYAQPNRLGVALMLDSHMKQLKEDLKRRTVRQTKANRFTLKKSAKQNDLNAYSQALLNNCYICQRIDGFFNRYLDTFFYLWKKEADFRQTLATNKGFCLQHFTILFDLAPKHLKGDALDAFTEILVKSQEANFNRVLDDLEWFINKYDYRYANEPWKSSKDAIVRSIEKVASIHVE